jgi:cyclohexanone monooxygenase
MSDGTTPSAPDLDFDPDALRAKYRQERDKRLRPDGDFQYVETTSEFAHYAEDDPYADPNFTRAPLNDEVEVVIIGGGFAGLFAAARLREAGLKDIRIIEAGSDFGGTWYWNRYPGCQCDIDSYTYVPLLEETGYMPSQRYTYSPEIYEQCKRIGKHFNLYDLALFQTRVRDLRWDEASKRWLVRTSRGDSITAQFVVTATGPLNKPKLPGIPGITEFEGHSFHTSRWDFNYTGGDNQGGLHKLADKRVAIIGSASTAVQAIPHLGAHAKHLYVFQRTPVAVFPRNNKPTDPEWVNSLKPGWQRERVDNFNQVVTGQQVPDLVNDCWTEIYRTVQTQVPLGQTTQGKTPADFAKEAEIADFKKMNKIRARVDSLVKDPKIAELLKPWFRVFCKRPTFHDEYLNTFNRPNVTLVDVSESQGVERITKKGVVAGGVEYEVDCIIFATGFEISTELQRRVDYQVYGVGGQSMFDYWKSGRRTLHGFYTHGFPNLFNCGVSQNGLSMNFSSMYGAQADHIAYVIKEVKARGAYSVQPTAEAEAAWVDTIKSLARKNEGFLAECTPSYFNNDGKFKERSAGFLSDAYTPGIVKFNALMADWRTKGDLEGLDVQ